MITAFQPFNSLVQPFSLFPRFSLSAFTTLVCTFHPSCRNSICICQVYHYWVKQHDGVHKSENATVVTPLSQHYTFHYKKDKEVTEEQPELVLRPELNCLYQGEEELTNALLHNYLIPPPKKATMGNIIRQESLTGTLGASHRKQGCLIYHSLIIIREILILSLSIFIVLWACIS